MPRKIKRRQLTLGSRIVQPTPLLAPGKPVRLSLGYPQKQTALGSRCLSQITKPLHIYR